MVPTDLVNIIISYVRELQNLEKQTLRLLSCAEEIQRSWCPPPNDRLGRFRFKLTQLAVYRFVMSTLKAGYMPQFWIDRLFEELSDETPGPYTWSTGDSMRSWSWEFFHSNTELAFLWQVLPDYVKDPSTYAIDETGEAFFL